MNLNALDLNLVKILDALLSERSVSAAARRVGLSQPAASHALRRLRDLLADPLLAPGQGGSVLTRRAEALRDPVRRALAALEETFRAPVGFDPGTARRLFTIASTDFVGLIVMPKIWPLIAKHAPGVEIDVKTATGASTFESLRNGTFDLALGVLKALPRDIAFEHLFEERFVLVVRNDHPLLEGELTRTRRGLRSMSAGRASCGAGRSANRHRAPRRSPKCATVSTRHGQLEPVCSRRIGWPCWPAPGAGSFRWRRGWSRPPKR